MCDSFRISEFDVKKSSGMQQNHSQNVSRWWSRSLQDCSQNGHFKSESYGLLDHSVKTFQEQFYSIPLNFFTSKPPIAIPLKKNQR